jgi:hypothetical protein
MSNKPEQPARREFIKAAGLGAALALPAATALTGRLFGASAQAQAPVVAAKETDPMAIALGYKEDATKVDTKKYPKRAGPDGPTQFCRSCALYTVAKGTDPKTVPTAPCAVLGNKAVKGGGWCNSWTKRPAT